MARVTIIGGHGKVALLAAPKLVAAGHEVTSVIRNPDHVAEVEATGATAAVADVQSLDVAAMTALLQGADAVVWSAGASGGNPERTYAVDPDAAIRSMDAAAAAGVGRYVMVSYLGSSRNHGISPDDGFYAYAESKAIADEHLRGTTLAWTILKPGRLSLEASPGTMNPTPDPAGDTTTARDLVADVIVAVLGATPAALSHKEIPFTDGDVPIATALGLG